MYDELAERLRSQARLDRYYNGTGKLYDDAANAIESLSEDNAALNGTVTKLLEQIKELGKPRWIPVTERLPKYGDWVLGIGPKKGYHVCEYRGISHFVYGGDSPWFSAKGRSITVTHWMPLPTPPTAEEGK